MLLSLCKNQFHLDCMFFSIIRWMQYCDLLFLDATVCQNSVCMLFNEFWENFDKSMIVRKNILILLSKCANKDLKAEVPEEKKMLKLWGESVYAAFLRSI